MVDNTDIQNTDSSEGRKIADDIKEAVARRLRGAKQVSRGVHLPPISVADDKHLYALRKEAIAYQAKYFQTGDKIEDEILEHIRTMQTELLKIGG